MQSSDFPLFVIDNEYYGEQHRFIYERYFTNELMGLPRKTKYKDIPEEMDGQLYYFEFGNLIKVANEL